MDKILGKVLARSWRELGWHNLGILGKVLARSWQFLASSGQVLGKFLAGILPKNSLLGMDGPVGPVIAQTVYGVTVHEVGLEEERGDSDEKMREEGRGGAKEGIPSS